ncbi:hypothetical protein [Snodgrassella sp. CFCC 13594]|uniref:hypothetical protein n=1 Tax=Snodgrassella sp. CFCC 13594 TaxID=1775559 RepID=UPI0008375036|nr:hypothetical protein [Snodgrassella sp. CFCC 13594]
MKWLFAILVALNIVVFGSMVAGKIAHMNHAEPQPAASDAALAVDPANPSISVAGTMAASRPAPAAKANTAPTSTSQPSPANTESKTTATDDSKTAPTSAANCSASAVLPEDDYHRLKGLLNRWPHSATRFVDTRAPAKSSKPRNTRYMAAIPGAGPDIATNLKSQNFDYAINQGQVSLGVFGRRSDAEAVVARAKLSGFGNAQVVALGNQQDDGDAASSMAKMRVNFTQVNDQDAQDINRIIGRYSKLQRSSCRQ